jgi:hypothetical protein
MDTMTQFLARERAHHLQRDAALVRAGRRFSRRRSRKARR